MVVVNGEARPQKWHPDTHTHTHKHTHTKKTKKGVPVADLAAKGNDGEAEAVNRDLVLGLTRSLLHLQQALNRSLEVAAASELKGYKNKRGTA